MGVLPQRSLPGKVGFHEAQEARAQRIDRVQQCADDLAEDWDNVGLLVGQRQGDAARVMTCLTVTPASGRRSIYLDPKKLVGVDGFEDDEGVALAERLAESAIRDDFVYAHDWRNGDVVLWDNARLMHKRDAFDERAPRLGKRTTLHMDRTRFAVP